MKSQTIVFAAGPSARVVDRRQPAADTWHWIDLVLSPEDSPEDLRELLDDLDLDTLSLHDAVNELDLPKVDEFDGHLLVVLHGVGADEKATHEVDCFLTLDTLVTVRSEPSLSIEALAKHLVASPELAGDGPGELLAKLGDVVSRRYLSLLNELDQWIARLTDMALAADPQYLEHLTEARQIVGDLRQITRPQREVFDQLRRSQSPVVSDAARRRFSDVFDLAQRSNQELEMARTELSETLGAYQGAEARKATDVTRVLTIYAAVVLPLSLIAGLFGMNFGDLPGATNPHGFWIIIGVMGSIIAVSLGLFATYGWIRLPSKPRASAIAAASAIRRSISPPVVTEALRGSSKHTMRIKRKRSL